MPGTNDYRALDSSTIDAEGADLTCGRNAAG
jgi:hypothetical protein